MASEEERIGYQSSRGSARDFNNFILWAGLMDTGYNGNKFTWCKREHGLHTKWAQLDRFLVNNGWGIRCTKWRVDHLERKGSDHAQSMMRPWKNQPTWNGKLFRYKRIWSMHEDFRDFVKRHWHSAGYSPCPMIMLDMKIKQTLAKMVEQKYIWRCWRGG